MCCRREHGPQRPQLSTLYYSVSHLITLGLSFVCIHVSFLTSAANTPRSGPSHLTPQQLQRYLVLRYPVSRSTTCHCQHWDKLLICPKIQLLSHFLLTWNLPPFLSPTQSSIRLPTIWATSECGPTLSHHLTSYTNSDFPPTKLWVPEEYDRCVPIYV